MSRRPRAAMLVVCGLLAAITAAAQKPAPPKTATAKPATPARSVVSPTLAMVADQRIRADEVEQGFAQALQLFKARSGYPIDAQLEPVVRRQVLENLIRQRLLALEARRRGIAVSDADAEAQLKRDPIFTVGGAFNESRYQTLKATNPDAYARSMETIKTNLAAQRARAQMEREVQVGENEARKQVETELTHVSLDYLALRANEFDGTIPEPRESEMLAAYRAQGDRYRLPQQAVLSIIVIDSPPIADSAGATAAGYTAWDQMIRARADSARAAFRAGARFEDIASLHGGIRRHQVVSRDRTPELWSGTPREVTLALAAAPGTVLAEPVRVRSGWGLVRVESVLPSRIAPLRDVSKAIRNDLRAEARRKLQDQDLVAIYQTMKDSLQTEGWRIRYAVADTAGFTPSEPTAQDLDRFYRSHLADYSAYDRTTSQVVETPLARVRDDVRRRCMSERRSELARAAAERLRDTWSRGRRDPALEKSMAVLGDPGVIPTSVSPVAGELGETIMQELTRRGAQPGTSVIAVTNGFAVIQLAEVIPRYVPTLEQSRSLLADRLELRASERLEADARRLFDSDSSQYSSSPVIHFTRAVVEPPDIMQVSLTRAEVERWYRSHISEYTVAEMVRVRHILISPEKPGATADAAARAKAEDILRRVKAGEDWIQLCAKYSDDPATKDSGGDVGMFRHGMMREAFERAAFAMRPGQTSGLVKTEVGYHILECIEYLPPVFHSLGEVYANVAHDCAQKKAVRIAGDRADSLLAAIKTVAQAKAAVAKLHLTAIPTDHAIGTLSSYGAELRDYIRTLETLKPGQLHPRVQIYEGFGPVITWVEGITPQRPRPWLLARPFVIQTLRNGRARQSLVAKRAELDSMIARGWSVDSIATLWAGPERMPEAAPGGELTGLRGRALLDSLVFGVNGHDPVLTSGRYSDWIEFPGGLARIRVGDRMTPDPEDLAKRVEFRRQVLLWRRQNEYFDRLKAIYPVQILDGELRATALPEPAEES